MIGGLCEPGVRGWRAAVIVGKVKDMRNWVSRKKATRVFGIRRP